MGFNEFMGSRVVVGTIITLLGLVALACSIIDVASGKVQMAQKGAALGKVFYRATDPFQFWCIVLVFGILGIVFVVAGLMQFRRK